MPAESYACGYVTCRAARSRRAADRVSRVSTPRKSTRPPAARCARSRSGISRAHGAHQDAQTFTTSGRPCTSATVVPGPDRQGSVVRGVASIGVPRPAGHGTTAGAGRAAGTAPVPHDIAPNSPAVMATTLILRRSWSGPDRSGHMGYAPSRSTGIRGPGSRRGAS